MSAAIELADRLDAAVKLAESMGMRGKHPSNIYNLAAEAAQSLRSQAGVSEAVLRWVPVCAGAIDLKAETALGGYTMSFDAPTAGGAVNLWMAGADVDTFEVFDSRKEAAAAAEADYRARSLARPAPIEITEEMREEALRLLQERDNRDDRVQDIIEELREIILLMPAASRPDGLFKHAQDAVYAMRGRTRLMDDAAITAALQGETK